MRVVVTGGRYYDRAEFMWQVLTEIHQNDPITIVAHGSCPYGGADEHAETWAKNNEIPYVGLPAKFITGTHGRAEGPLRNQRLLDVVKPHLVLAFGGNRGTSNCIKEAKKRGIEVREFDRD